MAYCDTSSDVLFGRRRDDAKVENVPATSDVNKDLTFKAKDKDKDQDQTLKAKDQDKD